MAIPTENIDIAVNLSELSISGSANVSTITRELITGVQVIQGPKGDPGDAGAWGDIVGNISDQADLQAALDAKVAKGELVINVKDYGAMGDGTTNDSAAIQLAVDTANANGGGTLFAPTGVYILEAGIKWLTGVSLYGAGPGKTIFKQRGSLVDAFYNLDAGPSDGGGGAGGITPLTNIVFRDFEIDGSLMTYTSPSVSGKGIYMLYMEECSFYNLYVHDCIGTGIGADFLDNVVIDSCKVSHNGRNWTGSGTTIGQSGIGIGTNWKTTEAVTITNCHSINNGNYGFFVETQSTIAAQTIWPTGAMFKGCYAEGNRHGFGNKGSGGTLFSGCESNNNIKYGFYSNTKCKDDTYSGCKASGNLYGIYVENTLGGTTIVGCDIHDNTQHGVTIFNGGFATWEARNLTISSNRISGNGYIGIRVEGFTTAIRNITISGNTIVDNASALVSFNRQGILLGSTVTDGIISSNFIGNTAGSTSQQYGLQLSSSGVFTNIFIVSNTFLSNATSPALIQGTLTNVVQRTNNGIIDDKATVNGLDANSKTITSVANPVNAQDAATKNYTDGNYVSKLSENANLVTYTSTLSTGNSVWVKAEPTFDQTGTAGYYIEYIDITDTGSGSGPKYFVEYRYNGASVFRVGATTGEVRTNEIRLFGTGGLYSDTTAGLMRISGGTSDNGGVIVLGGSTNGSIPNKGIARIGSTDVFNWVSTGVSMLDAKDISFGTTTGTKIGTATSQKLAFFNSTPIIKPTGSIPTALSNLGLVATPTIAESDITNLVSDLALKAPLASPTFTGTVTVPAPSNATDAATKNYVDTGNIQSISTKTANYTLTASDHTILFDATSGGLTAALPAAASHTGRIFVVKKIDASANTVTIDGNASETIDGALTNVISTQYAAVTIQSSGTDWFII